MHVESISLGSFWIKRVRIRTVVQLLGFSTNRVGIVFLLFYETEQISKAKWNLFVQ